MRVFIVSQYPAAKRGNQPENAMTKEEAKKKQLLAAYAWGRHSAAAPECFALDPDKLVALCAMGVMPPKVEKGAGSTPATGSAGNGVSVGEQPAVTCVATTTNTMSAGEKTAGAKHTPGPWTSGSARTGRVFGADGYEVCDPTQGPHLHVDYDSDRGHWATTPGAYVDRTDEEIEANARLIAAAPDLLEGAALIARLETNEETLERTGDQQSGDDAVETLSGLIHKARALVAKAEGRS